MAKPTTADRIASTRLSVSNCRTTRPLVAPSAARRPISFSRLAAWASRRLARFTQAIRSTRPTIPIIIPPASAICVRLFTPTAASARGVSATLRLALSFGYALSRCVAMVFSDASAAATLTPSFNRPNIAVVRNLRSLKLSLKKPAST